MKIDWSLLASKKPARRVSLSVLPSGYDRNSCKDWRSSNFWKVLYLLQKHHIKQTISNESQMLVFISFFFFFVKAECHVKCALHSMTCTCALDSERSQITSPNQTSPGKKSIRTKGNYSVELQSNRTGKTMISLHQSTKYMYFKIISKANICFITL